MNLQIYAPLHCCTEVIQVHSQNDAIFAADFSAKEFLFKLVWNYAEKFCKDHEGLY